MRKMRRFLIPTSIILVICVIAIIVNHKRIERLFIPNEDDLLWVMAYGGNIETVRALLDKGADVNARHDGWTPLMAAADQGQLEVARLLLSKGADVNAKTEDGYVALVNAIESSRLEMVKLLLDHGADPNIIYARAGITPLLDAAMIGVEKIVFALIEKGADVNAAGGHGTTPLMGAAAVGNEKVVRLLLEQGADVGAKRDDGKTALSLARERGHEEIAQILLNAGATAGPSSR